MGFDDLPIIHPRLALVDKARGEISKALWDTLKKHDLTYMEAFSILSGEIVNLAKYGIQKERHPNDPDKGGDEA